MRTGLLIAVAVLICVSIGVQIVYARTYAASATRSVRIVWGLNIGLLALLLVALIAYAVIGEAG